MIKRGRKEAQNGGTATEPQAEAPFGANLPPIYADGIQVVPGGEVATVVFTHQGQAVARLAISARLVADMPGVWQTAAARMGLFERDGATG